MRVSLDVSGTPENKKHNYSYNIIKILIEIIESINLLVFLWPDNPTNVEYEQLVCAGFMAPGAMKSNPHLASGNL
jgi:hypothetical protein